MALFEDLMFYIYSFTLCDFFQHMVKNAHVYQKQPYFDFKKLVLTFAFAYVCAWYIEYALSYPAVRKVFSFSPGNSVL